MNTTNYILAPDNRTPVPCPDVMEWAEWFEYADNLIVCQAEKGGVQVSTVFLAFDHRFHGNGPPVLWETMVFGGEHDGHQWRYTSHEEAVAGHKAACLMVWPELA